MNNYDLYQNNLGFNSDSIQVALWTLLSNQITTPYTGTLIFNGSTPNYVEADVRVMINDSINNAQTIEEMRHEIFTYDDPIIPLLLIPENTNSCLQFIMIQLPLSQITLCCCKDMDCIKTMCQKFDSFNTGETNLTFDDFTLETNDSNHPLMIFDSENPTGGDTDLGTPNENFGGPGIGTGGESGAGVNDVGLGKVLIISSDNNSSNPNDYANGGTITINFIDEVYFRNIKILDSEQSVNVKTFDSNNNQIASYDSIVLGDNSVETIITNDFNTKKVEITFIGSGAIAEFCYDKCWNVIYQNITNNDNTTNESGDVLTFNWGHKSKESLIISDRWRQEDTVTEDEQTHHIYAGKSGNVRIDCIMGIEKDLKEGSFEINEIRPDQFNDNNVTNPMRLSFIAIQGQEQVQSKQATDTSIVISSGNNFEVVKLQFTAFATQPCSIWHWRTLDDDSDGGINLYHVKITPI
jgi:hypothetical protein